MLLSTLELNVAVDGITDTVVVVVVAIVVLVDGGTTVLVLEWFSQKFASRSLLEVGLSVRPIVRVLRKGNSRMNNSFSANFCQYESSNP